MHRFINGVLLPVVLLVSASTATGQEPDPAPVKAAIGKLDFMVGRWSGEAWQQRGNEKVHTKMREVVERKLDGAVIQVEGRGTIQTPAGAEQVVHHALGIISYDPQTARYTLRSYLANGRSGDFDVTLVDGGVSWSLVVPGGRVRNTARYTADEWHEIGEFSRDGTIWSQTMELRLRRER